MAADDGKLSKEYKEKVIVKAIRDNIKTIQKCYLDYLAAKDQTITEGNINALIRVNEDGSIETSKITQNEFKDESFGDCIAKEMKALHLSPPPLGINRYIDHTLSFKSEETALREAEEQRKKSQLPQVLPVSPE